MRKFTISIQVAYVVDVAAASEEDARRFILAEGEASWAENSHSTDLELELEDECELIEDPHYI